MVVVEERGGDPPPAPFPKANSSISSISTVAAGICSLLGLGKFIFTPPPPTPTVNSSSVVKVSSKTGNNEGGGRKLLNATLVVFLWS